MKEGEYNEVRFRILITFIAIDKNRRSKHCLNCIWKCQLHLLYRSPSRHSEVCSRSIPHTRCYTIHQIFTIAQRLLPLSESKMVFVWFIWGTELFSVHIYKRIGQHWAVLQLNGHSMAFKIQGALQRHYDCLWNFKAQSHSTTMYTALTFYQHSNKILFVITWSRILIYPLIGFNTELLYIVLGEVVVIGSRRQVLSCAIVA